MSTAVVSTSAAPGRPFLFDDDHGVHVGTAAIGCPVERSSTKSRQDRLQSTINKSQSKFPPASITPASRLEIRPVPDMVTSGIPALDALTGGLPRGCLTEICGPASSGRTSVMLAALASATRRGEYCALIDASDALDPHSLAVSGIDLDHLLWVRCKENSPQRKNSPRSHRDTGKKKNGKEFIANNGFGERMIGKGTASAVPHESHNDAALAAEGRPFPLRNTLFRKTDRNFKPRIDKYNSGEDSPNRNSEHRLEQVLRTTDLLLESGGFGLIVLDLADIPPQFARRIPLTTWFRFRRAVEHKPTILLSIEQQPIAGSCSSLLLQLRSPITKDECPLDVGTTDESAAKRRKNAAHGVSRGLSVEVDQALEGRKKNCIPEETLSEASSPSHTNLLTELGIHAELIRSRLDRKPARSIAFETKTAWAG